MSRPGGLQLSPIQITASLLATLTGAVLASYLGVGGTLAGAAVGSIASTTGTEVYRHYLRRSQQGLKAAGEVLKTRQTGQHARHTAAHPADQAQPGPAATETIAAGAAARETVTSPYGSRRRDTSADATETYVFPAATGRWPGRPDAGPGRPGAEPGRHTASEHATGDLSGAVPAGGAGGSGGGPWWRDISRRRWLAYGGVALGLFLGAVVVITIIELSVGKPLNSAVWGKPGTGTSVGSLVGGSGRHSQPATPPSSSTPTSRSSSPAVSSSPSAATPSATAPSPTASVSSSPSSAPSATPTPGGPGSEQSVTPTP
ncbi:MAG TPA: hypothetical protein VMH35_04455 [Streptosporangiaceae bacterium]|nr:hypothetical protein [Streptosporangiaceae bacterium]